MKKTITLLFIPGIFACFYMSFDQAQTLEIENVIESEKILANTHFHESAKEYGIDHSFLLAPLIQPHSKTAQDKLDDILPHAHKIMTGGLAVGDINDDDLPDIFLVGGERSSNKLYLNKGNGHFLDITEESGIHAPTQLNNGAVFADIDGDGLDDLFIGGVANFDQSTSPPSWRAPTYSVYKNLGSNQFTDVTTTSGLVFLRNIFSASFSDFDKDGDLDAAFGHWHRAVNGQTDRHLWLNDGRGQFTPFNESILSPFDPWPEVDWSFTPSFADINNDGWPDLLFTSDFENTMYFINRDGNWFANYTRPDVISDENGMGHAIGDINNDGRIDWFVSSVYDPDKNDYPSTSSTTGYKWGTTGNRLYKNTGQGDFENITASAGVADGGWGWGSCMADFNLDGFLDIFHVNGFYASNNKDQPQFAQRFANMPPRLFINNGNETFTDKAEKWGFDSDEGRAISCTDFDRDGDVDVLIQQFNNSTKLYINEARQMTKNSFLGVRLNGKPGNPHAAGARIILEHDDSMQTRELRIGSNYLSQNATEALFGLAQASGSISLKIYWNGMLAGDEPQVLSDVGVNQWLIINQPN